MVFDTFWTGSGTVFGDQNSQKPGGLGKKHGYGRLTGSGMVDWNSFSWICQVEVISVSFFPYFNHVSFA